MSRRSCAAMACVLLMLPLAALAQGNDLQAQAELKRIETDFEYGKYDQVLESAEARLELGALDDEVRCELHRLAGLSAFNLEKPDQAERNFRHVLRLDPDYTLDPFRVPPPAIELFDQVRRGMAAELPELRARKAAREAAQREEEASRLRERSELEALRTQLDELNRRVTVRYVERQNRLVNFMPLGLGQFQQGRVGVGVGLAVGQGALAATSVLAYVARWSLRETVVEEINGRVGEDVYRREAWLLPSARKGEDEMWAAIQLSTGFAFFGAWAFGIIDALIHHKDMVQSEPVEVAPSEAPPSALPLQAPRLDITLLPGGAAAGLSVRF